MVPYFGSDEKIVLNFYFFFFFSFKFFQIRILICLTFLISYNNLRNQTMSYSNDQLREAVDAVFSQFDADNSQTLDRN